MYSTPSRRVGVTGNRVISASQGAARPTAFTPSQGRALWARLPRTVTWAFIEPTQPISALSDVGSSSTASRASRSHGIAPSTRVRPLASSGPSSAS